MVYPLAGLRPESANRSYFTGFETQKELDPDFVAFNSENRRYHFPARVYLPIRGAFAQIDPLVQEIASSPAYSYAEDRPTSLVDPAGLLAKYVKGAKNCLSAKKRLSDICTEGQFLAEIQIDADWKKTDRNLGLPFNSTSEQGALVGVGAWFSWQQFTYSPRKAPAYCGDETITAVRCSQVCWKQESYHTGAWTRDQRQGAPLNAQGCYDTFPQPSMDDYPWAKSDAFLLRRTDFYRAKLVCINPGMPDQVFYSVDWGWALRLGGYVDPDVSIIAWLFGRCGDAGAGPPLHFGSPWLK